ncbi:isocitrate/isopropylmalate dehydrogenase family protein [Nocardia huaxiensis]|uniref:Isocitrate/isopropylmalate dehydrogenase family protein n=1 Tax=Nocardia huaxiensis TaxID=2755382 RepID=A0A7D6ZTW1_9NOCA|nr:isocitrate/isopropylmalate family dehydrogenase [Nocardia huaxiensis]QLY33765.1 isocitrate/isopropylmalate dehydrogenase family protein [Nocardia huaxiensis]UFS99309.1 isocitrate/isopropylmalate dehydrogenase family protein [Nocardia huaxiensis]
MSNTETRLRLGLIEGDGIGPEIVRATRDVVDEALKVLELPPVEWVPLLIGHAAIAEFGDPMPEQTLKALAGLDAWIMGPHDNASYAPEYRAGLPPAGAVRKRFGLYANIRWARTHPDVRSVADEMDLIIVRENSEGLYADRNMFAGSGEFQPTADTALAVGVFTHGAIERIAHQAFRIATRRRKKVTIVHKANVLPMTMGMFRDVCYEVAEQYPDVETRDEHVDAMTALLVRNPADFDVIVTENLFGDILSDLAGELSGSLGMAASLNSSDTQAMAQAVHGAAPTLAGHNRANPVAMLLSAVGMLRWLGTRDVHSALYRLADRIEHAVAETLRAGVATSDLGGLASTTEFTEQVRARLHRW